MKLFDATAHTNWKFIAIVASATLVVGGGMIAYLQSTSQNYVPPVVAQPSLDELFDTFSWNTYYWDDGNLSVRYPSGWTVEKQYYASAAQQSQGEKGGNIAIHIFPGSEEIGKNFIAIGGRQVSCNNVPTHTKCQYISDIANYIYTDSQTNDVLNTFQALADTVEEFSTADWQTYRNEKLGFEFKYPNHLRLKEFSSVGNSDGGAQLLRDDAILSSYQISRASISIEELLSVERNFSELGKPKIIENLTIDNKPAIKIKYGGIPVPQIWAENKNKTFIFQYNIYQGAEEDEFSNIISTVRFIGIKKVVLPTTCKNEPEGTPVIASISPTSGPVGTEVEIRGCNLAGFEGDLDATFVRSDGAKIGLYGGIWSPEYGGVKPGKLIKVTIESYCDYGFVTGRYSGIISRCEKVEATPGIYKVSVNAWGETSNEVNFSIQSSPTRTEVTQLTGFFSVIWGDPPVDSGLPALQQFYLYDSQNKTTKITITENTQFLGGNGISYFDRKTVKATGEFDTDSNYFEATSLEVIE